jgi:hypothetical protein
MEINRSNYELWLIDWLDSNLPDLQVEQLKFFLNENPDLLEEVNELNQLILKPSENSFTQKVQIIKSSSDLYDSQFDYLCIALNENDLNTEQKTELLEIIDNDNDKKRRFDLLRKIKLIPGSDSYKNKRKIIKITPLQKIIRNSFIGLSAAAAVTLLIMNYFLIPGNLPEKVNNTSFNIIIDSTLSKPTGLTVSEKTVSNQKPVITKQISNTLPSEIQKNSPGFIENISEKRIPEDSLFRKSNPAILLSKIRVFQEVSLNETRVRNSLVASKNILVLPPSDNEQSNVSKFIARTFRVKILKERIAKDTPLKGYEIAEAGVSGLNKLLGWEMALDQKKDANGELSSVYFSSKLLKFTAPVKKNEPLP